jgi:hypothetical protein
MKSPYAFFILLALTINIQAQELAYNSSSPSFTSAPFEGKNNSLPRKFRAVSLKFGPRFLNAEAGTVITKFTDDSPSQDKFESTSTIKDSYTNFGVHFSYDWRKYAGLNHSLYIDYAYGDNPGFLIGYNVGWNIVASDKIILRPAVNFALASSNFKLGQIENNAGFIAIGNNEYNGKYLDVSLNGDYTVWGPQLDLRYLLSNNFHAILNINYDIANESNPPKLKFSPTDDGDNQATSSKPINMANPLLTYNGRTLTSFPAKLGGIRISLGASYVWNRN